MIGKILKADIKRRKDSYCMSAGTKVWLTFPKEYHGAIVRITDGKESISTRTPNMKKYFGTRLPSLKTLEKYVYDGICKSVLGNNVEPDGWDSQGSPSWLLAMGLI